ncbi:hypothetical protein COO60DRAFT_1495424 [Scenedesmus sp. NREL 46B-D3]|nr:hypothetical protein COO60DRAFT_1495424 [Scenedesmus sp. NREL 46B-D3]
MVSLHGALLVLLLLARLTKPQTTLCACDGPRPAAAKLRDSRAECAPPCTQQQKGARSLHYSACTWIFTPFVAKRSGTARVLYPEPTCILCTMKDSRNLRLGWLWAWLPCATCMCACKCACTGQAVVS